jgi:Holliday junction resolvasome RuvABC endonuclease subunit
VLAGGPDKPAVWTATIKPRLHEHERLDEIIGRVTTFVQTARPGEVATVRASQTFVVVEGPLYNVPKVKMGDGTKIPSLRGYHERAGLWWMIVHRLWRLGIPVAIASPANVKLFATGKGNAAKDRVLAAAVRKFPEIESNDEADALCCAALGAQRLGVPLVQFEPNLYRERAEITVKWWRSLDETGRR